MTETKEGIEITEDDIEIFKDAVVGFVVSKHIAYGFEQIIITPITVDSSCISNDIEFDQKNESVISTLPAPSNSYAVLAMLKDRDCDCPLLGYEIGGATHPDWIQEAIKYFEEEDDHDRHNHYALQELT